MTYINIFGIKNMRIRIDTHRERLLIIALGLVGLLRLIKSILYAPEVQRGFFYVSQAGKVKARLGMVCIGMVLTRHGRRG